MPSIEDGGCETPARRCPLVTEEVLILDSLHSVIRMTINTIRPTVSISTRSFCRSVQSKQNMTHTGVTHREEAKVDPARSERWRFTPTTRELEDTLAVSAISRKRYSEYRASLSGGLYPIALPCRFDPD